MSTTRIKDKISAVVSNQLPEFVKADYSTFVLFLETYYKFLEQDQSAYEIIKNASSYNDIDSTTDSFVKYFLSYYASYFPSQLGVNQRLLVKKINDLYQSKGSSISFNMLFNLVYQTDIELLYPYDNVLRASDGKWQQRTSLHLRTIAGDRTRIDSRILNYTSNNVVYATPITESTFFNNEITEVFLDVNFLAPQYNIGDNVTVTDGTNVIYTGQVSPTLTTYSISSAGENFKRGQIFYVNYEGGQGSLVQVANVSNVGALVDLRFLTYGGNYPNTSFTLQLSPTSTVAFTSDGFRDRTQGFKSEGSVYLLDPSDVDRYFDVEYVSGNSYTITGTVTSFQNNTFSAVSASESETPGYASVTFSPGSIGKYRGNYVTNQSFLSEAEVRIQDELRYQPFAYQIDSPLDISEFFDIVKQLIHPAGQRLYSNRILTTTADLSANVTVNVIPFISVSLLDSFDIVESKSLFITKPVTDLSSTSDNTNYTLYKPLVDATETASDLVSKEFKPVYTDNTSSFESVTFAISKELEDAQTVLENLSKDINKTINNTTNTSDSLSIIIDDFFAEDYTEEFYAGSSLV